LTRKPSLSDIFDSDDFISPDILTSVNASVREVAAGVVEREGLSIDLDHDVDVSAKKPAALDATRNESVPSLDPEE